jgi:hypothetical protein
MTLTPGFSGLETMATEKGYNFKFIGKTMTAKFGNKAGNFMT